MGDFLVRSWAADYERLQAVDLPHRRRYRPWRCRTCWHCVRPAWESRNSAYHGASCPSQHAAPGSAAAMAAGRPAGTGAAPHCRAHGGCRSVGGHQTQRWVLVNNAVGAWTRRLWDWERPGCTLGSSGGAGLGYGMGAALGAVLGASSQWESVCEPAGRWRPVVHAECPVDGGASPSPGARRHVQQPLVL